MSIPYGYPLNSLWIPYANGMHSLCYEHAQSIVCPSRLEDYPSLDCRSRKFGSQTDAAILRSVLYTTAILRTPSLPTALLPDVLRMSCGRSPPRRSNEAPASTSDTFHAQQSLDLSSKRPLPAPHTSRRYDAPIRESYRHSAQPVQTVGSIESEHHHAVEMRSRSRRIHEKTSQPPESGSGLSCRCRRREGEEDS